MARGGEGANSYKYSFPGRHAAGAMNTTEIVGYVVDGSTPLRAKFVSRQPPRLGDYVVIDVDGESFLAIVGENISTRSITLSTAIDVYDPRVVEYLAKKMNENDVFYECSARFIYSIDSGARSFPSKPPLPGTPVVLAPSKLLENILGGDKGDSIRIGSLSSRPSVGVYISANKLVTRHLAILAVTGAGKSNTVAILLDRITERFGATSIVFDFHGEYAATKFSTRQHLIEPLINPRNLSVNELMVLMGIEPRFYNQERVLRRAYEQAKSLERSEPRAFLELLREKVEQNKRDDLKAINAVLNKIDALREKHGYILDDSIGDVAERIEIGAINIVDLSGVDEEAADVIVSHFLRKLLGGRKRFRREGKGIPVPVLIVLEEAHVLIPRDRGTLTKYWASRIAREGRKFGVGLVLVSQRPKSLDPDALSQMNNKIVLRIVEPSDQRYIREASETLSEDLVEQLPGLGVGEAIIIGPFIPIPARVRIDKFPGQLGGSDPDIVGEWLSYSANHGGYEGAEHLIMDEVVELKW